MNLSVVIVTLNRPDCVRKCLQHLENQTRRPEQVLVVDASKDQRTKAMVEEFPGVLYLRNEAGYGHMSRSRNIGLLSAVGDVIAFIDDDAYAHPDWAERLLAAYDGPTIGAVGGRVLSGGPAVAAWDPAKVGRLLPDGELYAGFDSDPGKALDVDHLMGCNMSFRREVLAELGGFRESYPGTEVCEESDMCLRVRRLGRRIRFEPAARVDHVGAPQVKGRRFDLRYGYYSGRNTCVLLIRNRGFFAPIVWRYYAKFAFGTFASALRQVAVVCCKSAAYVAGLTVGLAAGVVLYVRHGTDPIRHDDAGRAIASALRGPAADDGNGRRLEPATAPGIAPTIAGASASEALEG